MPTKSLMMTALAGAILAFAFPAGAMTNTMPAGLAKSADQVGQVEQARMVCGPVGCQWRPNYYGYDGRYGRYPGWRWRHPGWRWDY